MRSYLFVLLIFLFPYCSKKDSPVQSTERTKNLFGQPVQNPSCMLTEFNIEGTTSKRVLTYNDKKQVVKQIDYSASGNDTCTIEYNDKGLIQRITNFEVLDEIKLTYNASDVLEKAFIKQGVFLDTVTFIYNGDKEIKVQYPKKTGGIAGWFTHSFDGKYNLVKTTAEESLSSGTKKILEGIFTTHSSVNNFSLSLGDFRFVSLLYGVYINKGPYGFASVELPKKLTVSDFSTTPADVSEMETEVVTSNANGFPTSIRYKFANAANNYTINLIYTCN
jgi:hypothetical protein